jgi:hypothetical protein
VQETDKDKGYHVLLLQATLAPTVLQLVPQQIAVSARLTAPVVDWLGN